LATGDISPKCIEGGIVAKSAGQRKPGRPFTADVRDVATFPEPVRPWVLILRKAIRDRFGTLAAFHIAYERSVSGPATGDSVAPAWYVLSKKEVSRQLRDGRRYPDGPTEVLVQRIMELCGLSQGQEFQILRAQAARHVTHRARKPGAGSRVGTPGASIQAPGLAKGDSGRRAVGEPPIGTDLVASRGPGTVVDDGVIQGDVTNQVLALRRHPYLATVEEIAGHTPFLADRDADLQELSDFACGPAVYRWLQAPPWAGKTALAAHFILQLPLETDWLGFFVIKRLSEADSSQFLATLNVQLAYLLGEEVPAIPSSIAAYRDLWSAVVRRSAQLRRHLVLVVDGLDEDSSPRTSIGALLPAVPPTSPFVHILITSRHGYRLPADVALDHPLRTVIPSALVPSPVAKQCGAEARQELTLVLRDHDSGDLEFDVLGVLAAAKGKLAAQDIAAILDRADNRSISKIRRVLQEPLRRILMTEGDGIVSRYSFSHQSLASEAQENNVDADQHAALIRAWMDRCAAQGWTNAPTFAFDGYPGWVTANDPDRLGALLSDVAFVEQAVLNIGIDRVLHIMYAAVAISPALNDLTSCLIGQAYHLRQVSEGNQPDGFVTRQLSLEAIRLDNPDLNERLRQHLGRFHIVKVDPVATSATDLSGMQTPLRGQHEQVRAVAMSADGPTALTGGGDYTPQKGGELLLWNLTEQVPSCKALPGHDSAVEDVELSDSGSIGVTSDNGGRVLLWRFASGIPVSERLHGSSRYGHRVALTPDGTRAVVAGAGGTLDIYEIRSDNISRRSFECRHDVRHLAVNGDGTVIVAGLFRGAVVCWSVAASAASVDDWPQLLRVECQPFVTSVAISRDGGLLLVGIGDTADNGKLFCGYLQERRITQVESVDFAVKAAAFTADGQSAVAAGGWSFAAGRIVSLDFSPDGIQSRSFDPEDVGIEAAALSGDGRTLLTASYHKLSMLNLGAHDRKALAAPPHTGRVRSIVGSSAGPATVTSDFHSLIRWTVSGTRLAPKTVTLPVNDLSISHLDASSDFESVLVGCMQDDCGAVFRLQGAASSMSLEPIFSAQQPGGTVAISPSGRYAVAHLDNKLRWWRPGQTGTGELDIWNDELNYLSVSDSGTVLADVSWNDGWSTEIHTLKMWRIVDNDRSREVYSYELPDEGTHVLSVSGDLRTMATNGGLSGPHSLFVDVWALDSQEPTRRRIANHEKPVTAAALSADGHLLASCDDGGEFLVHDVIDGTLLQRTLLNPTLTAMRFGAGEWPYLFTGDVLGSVILWKTDR
jgi:WD40 repeat protein